MLTWVLWGVIILLLVLVAKRLGRGIVVLVVLIGAIFLSIFMLDTFTTFDTRKYISIGFYDKTVQNPTEAVGSLKEKAGESSKGIAGIINKVGERADKKYGTEIVATPKEDKKSKEVKKEKDGKSKEVKKKVKDEKERAPVENGEDGVIFIPYKDVRKVIDEDFDGMTDRDKSIAKTLVPMLPLRYSGDNYEIWNIRGEDGIYLKRLDS